MRCTSPAWIVVHSPASSVMVSCPNSMIVTISSSSWRCIPKPSLDWIKSSLKARSMPRRTLSGTYHSPYEKSQKACIHDRSTKWRSCAAMRVTISDPLMTTVKKPAGFLLSDPDVQDGHSSHAFVCLRYRRNAPPSQTSGHNAHNCGVDCFRSFGEPPAFSCRLRPTNQRGKGRPEKQLMRCVAPLEHRPRGPDEPGNAL